MCLSLVSMLKRQDDGQGRIKFVNIASMAYDPAENEGILYEEAMEVGGGQGRGGGGGGGSKELLGAGWNAGRAAARRLPATATALLAAGRAGCAWWR